MSVNIILKNRLTLEKNFNNFTCCLIIYIVIKVRNCVSAVYVSNKKLNINATIF